MRGSTHLPTGVCARTLCTRESQALAWYSYPHDAPAPKRTTPASSLACVPAAFPDEQEFLYPPGTYLSLKEGHGSTTETVTLTRQTSRSDVLRRQAEVTIVDVEASFPTV